MIFKNATGSPKRFSFGRTFCGQLAAGAKATVADTDRQALVEILKQARAGTVDILQHPPGVDLVPYNTYPPHLLIHLGNGVSQVEEDDSVTLGGVVITIAEVGANALLDATALKDAINASSTLTSLGVVAREVINSDGGGSTLRATLLVDLSGLTPSALAAFTASESGTYLSIENNAESKGSQRMVMHRVVATGAAAAVSVVIPTGLRDAQSAFAMVQDTDGKIKPIDGTVSLAGSLAAVNLAGSADLAATDKILLFAFGY